MSKKYGSVGNVHLWPGEQTKYTIRVCNSDRALVAIEEVSAPSMDHARRQMLQKYGKVCIVPRAGE